jgi:transcription antitermination factor NusG
VAPLFPSYVFACAGRDELVAALDIGRIARVVRINRQDLFLDELRQIRRAIAGDAEFTLGPALERGDRVRVIHGPLIGVEGLVQGLRRRRSHYRLILNVSMLGRAVATEVDARDVERVEFALDAAARGAVASIPCWRALAKARRAWT